MLSEADKQARRKHWTATDSARAISGLYGGLFQAVAEKVLPVAAASNSDESEAMEIGNALEGKLGEWALKTLDIAAAVKQKFVVSKADPLLAATLDLEIPDAIIELKTAGFTSKYADTSEWGASGTSDIPLYPMVQLHHQMMCAGVDMGYVAAWVMGRGRLLYQIKRDEKICEAITALAHHAWDNYVLKGILPEPPDDVADLAIQIYGKKDRAPGKSIAATAALRNAATLLEQCRAARLGIEKLEAHSKATVLHFMGDAEYSELDSKRTVVVKKVQTKGYTKVVKPGESISIVVKEKTK